MLHAAYRPTAPPALASTSIHAGALMVQLALASCRDTVQTFEPAAANAPPPVVSVQAASLLSADAGAPAPRDVRATAVASTTTALGLALDPCFGQPKPLVISSQMPYVVARVGASEGHFILDFATTASTADPKGFFNGPAPQPKPGTYDTFDDFDFYGPWGTVHLAVQDHSSIAGSVRQAGILGTDFLSSGVFTLDYEHGAVYRAGQGAFCSDEMLRKAGLKPLSTAGYYAFDRTQLKAGFPNVPTVPVRVGSARAVAQLDTGFDDALYRHSVNINRAFFTAIKAAGVELEQVKEASTTLSTCVLNQRETVTAYRLPRGAAFEFVDTDGAPVRSEASVMLFVKDTPAAAKSCGGIGTWTSPAAQVAASFYVDAKKLVFDPYTSRTWL